VSNINEFFNVEEISEESKTLEPVVHHPTIKENALDDYHSTRESMKITIDRGTEMIEDLMKVTKESESPRAYEVLSGYMKNLVEMNRSLIDLHKTVKEVTDEKSELKHEQSNFVFVGSTESLQQELEKNK